MPAISKALRIAGGQALLVVIAFAGGFVFARLGLPAPWVSGSMIAVALAAAQFPLPSMHPTLRDVALLAAGIAMGVGVTPETLRIMAAFPFSFAMLMVSMGAGTFLAAAFLTRRMSWRREDALLACVPGALSVVYAVAAERKADLAGIAVVQNLRLLALVVLLPTVVTFIEAGPPRSVAQGAILPAGALFVVAVAGIVVGALFERAGLPAGMLAGGAVVGIILGAPGHVSGNVPEAIAIAGYVLVGVFTGLRMGVIDRAGLIRHIGAGFCSFGITSAVALAGATLVSLLLGIRFGSSLLAFAPGGVEAMALLSLSLALDPLFVSAHHLLRFLSIGFVLPFLFRRGT